MDEIKEIFVSTDIEANGPIPGQNSMLSIGSAAFAVIDGSISLLDTYSTNLEELPMSVQDHKTMEWWKNYPAAYKANRENAIPPKLAMKSYLDWLKKMKGQVVFVAWPASYDFMFVYWYLMYFTGESPFMWSGLDSKSYFMGMTKNESWINTSMNKIPTEWIPENKHEHIALNDAIEQGWTFCNMYVANISRK